MNEPLLSVIHATRAHRHMWRIALFILLGVSLGLGTGPSAAQAAPATDRVGPSVGVGQSVSDFIKRLFDSDNAGDEAERIAQDIPCPTLKLDVVFVLDLSGSMNQAYTGSGSKLAAAKDAIMSTANAVAAVNNGSRLSLVTFRGSATGTGTPPIYSSYVETAQNWTTSAATFNATVAGVTADGGTTTAGSVAHVTDSVLPTSNAEHKKVVVLVSDGVPTIDMQGHGFQDSYVQQVALKDGSSWRASSDVRTSGQFYPSYNEYAGDPLADTMDELDRLMGTWPQALIYSVAVQSQAEGYFNADILDYAASVGAGRMYTASYAASLSQAMQDIIANVVCGTPTPASLLAPTACQLYPIALHSESLRNITPGMEIKDIWNGSQPGNFGWLSWNGGPSEVELESSLRPPGRSHLYYNPYNPDDLKVSPGDWIYGAPGVKNSSNVREALDILKTVDITVPVWDQAVGSGRNAVYRAKRFASVRITDYTLPSQNRISAIYKGEVDCGGTESFDPIVVACKPALIVNPGDTFNIRNYFRYAAPELAGQPINWTSVRFTYTEGGAMDPPSPATWHLNDFNAGIPVTATASDMASGTGNAGNGVYRLYAYRSGAPRYDDYITIIVTDSRPDTVDSAMCAPSALTVPTATPTVQSPFLPTLFILIDEDSIDSDESAFQELAGDLGKGADAMLNGPGASVGYRQRLDIPNDNVVGNGIGDPPGTTASMHTGEKGDEGWFAITTIPSSWVDAGPTTDGLKNFVQAGPGLGSGADPEALLDNVPNVKPLHDTDLLALQGQRICALVYKNDVGINYSPLRGNLKGANRGLFGFDVLKVDPQPGKKHLPLVTLRVKDAGTYCAAALYPEPELIPTYTPTITPPSTATPIRTPTLTPTPTATQPSPTPTTAANTGKVSGRIQLKGCEPPNRNFNELGANRVGVDVVHVVDVSGSMATGWGGSGDNSSPSIMSSMKTALVDLNNRLDSTQGDKAGLVSFGYGQTVNGYSGAYARIDNQLTGSIGTVSSSISNLSAKSSTALALGMQKGVEAVLGANHNSAQTPVLIVNSDGNANVRLDGIRYPLSGASWLEGQGIYDPLSSQQAIQIANNAKAQGVEIFAVAMGGDLDANVLRAIASEDRPGVQHFFEARNQTELVNVYANLINIVTFLRPHQETVDCDLTTIVDAPGATVQLLNPSTGALMASTTANGLGQYTFFNVTPGTYRMDAMLGDYDQQTTLPCARGDVLVPVTVAIGGTTTQNLYLGKVVPELCPATYSLDKILTSQSPTTIGNDVTFDIVITNTDDNRTIVELPLIDAFDNAKFEFLSAEPPPDQVSQASGILSWRDITEVLGDIAPGGSVTIKVRFRAIGDTGLSVAINRAHTENGYDNAGYPLPPLDASAWVSIGLKNVFVTSGPLQASYCDNSMLDWEASAYDGNYGTLNGSGITQVVFEVFDASNTLVYRRIDTSAKYCGFGETLTGCAELNLSGGVWTSVNNTHSVGGGPIVFGQRYRFVTTATGQSGKVSWIERNPLLKFCSVTETPTPTSTALPTGTSTPTSTPTSTSTPTPTLTPTVTPSPTGRPIGSILDNFNCRQVATFCKLDTWIDADAADTMANTEGSMPGVEAQWHSVFPKSSTTKWLQTGVNMPTWFWIQNGYDPVTVTLSSTQVNWTDLGPVAWCLGDGPEPSFSYDDGYALKLPLSVVSDMAADDDEVDITKPLDLPVPRFEYSSLGQASKVDVGPFRDVSAFGARMVSTWWVTGIVETINGPVALDNEVPVCEDVYVWVRQPQSVIVNPGQEPEWLLYPP